MTFTEFLISKPKNIPAPSFITLVRHDPKWPAASNYLRDFEAFLVSHLGEESPPAVAELRRVWSEFAYADPAGKHDLDIAVAAWADYAHHRATCTGNAGTDCYVDEALFGSALLASGTEDVDERSRVAIRCESEGESDDAEEGTDSYETDDEDDLLAEADAT